MNKAVRGYFAVLLLILPVAGIAAEEIEFGFKRWLSDGSTHWRHNSGSSYFGVPTSELDYQGVDSEITEFSIRTNLAAGHFIRATFGMGDIDTGRLVDDDYLSASGAIYYGATQSGAHRFSRTYSNITGNGLFYLKGEFGPENLLWNPSFGHFRFNFSAQYWEEEYQATGIEQIECTVLSHPQLSCYPAGTIANSGDRVITNTVMWTGLGLTMEGMIGLLPRLSLDLDMTFYPLMILVNEDVHHLRTSGVSALAQDPSIRMTGTGMGYDLMVGLRWQFSTELSAHLSYRKWERWVKDQTITFFYPDGTSSSAQLMDFSTRRDGIVAGIALVF